VQKYGGCGKRESLMRFLPKSIQGRQRFFAKLIAFTWAAKAEQGTESTRVRRNES
jgi:hypothetical protein